MDYIVRELKQNEINLLNTFLYEAIFIPEGVQAPSKDIIEHPDLQETRKYGNVSFSFFTKSENP